MVSKHLQTVRSFHHSLFFLACLFALDQWVKQVFASQQVLNTGVSFSFLTGVSSNVLIGLLLLLVGVLWFFTRKMAREGKFGWLGHHLFIGGALSNIFDRARYGGVRDIWQIPGTSLQNNLADWFIAIGVFALIISTLLNSSQNQEGREEQGNGTHAT